VENRCGNTSYRDFVLGSVNKQCCVVANCELNNVVLRRFKVYYVVSLKETFVVINAVIHNNVFVIASAIELPLKVRKYRTD
jgi:hypothetical protein